MKGTIEDEAKVCRNCKKIFTKDPLGTVANWRKRKCCSKRCALELETKTRNKKAAEFKKLGLTYDGKERHKTIHQKRRENGMNKPYGWKTTYLDPYLRMSLR